MMPDWKSKTLSDLLPSDAIKALSKIAVEASMGKIPDSELYPRLKSALEPYRQHLLDQDVLVEYLARYLEWSLSEQQDETA